MKRSLIVLSCLLTMIFFAPASAQPKSPFVTTEGTIDGVLVHVEYSAPSARGRKMLGGILPYGTVWRAGANKATVFEINKPIKVEGQALAAGKYELFAIPGETEWTIIFQVFKGQWGTDYAEANDHLRVKVKPGKSAAFVETFVIAVDKDKVTLQWENTAVSFKVAKG